MSSENRLASTESAPAETDADTSDLVVKLRRGGVVELTLNRPHRKNALVGPLVDRLLEHLRDLREDSDCRAVLLRGAGGCFCSGLDLKEIRADPPPEWWASFSGRWVELHAQLFEFDRPIVGALEGYAIAAGSGLALGCDLLVAGETSKLHVNEAENGMAAPLNVAWLRLKLSVARAQQMAMVARPYTGVELEQLGLITELVADDLVLERSRALAQRLAGFPGRGSQPTKAMLKALAPFNDPRAYFWTAVEAANQ